MLAFLKSWSAGLPGLAAALGIFLAAIMVSSSCSPEVYEGCQYHSDCDEGELCQDAECTEVGCIDSDDCGSGQYCGAGFECLAGCEDSEDCRAGEVCTKKNECKAYGCRDTELDCGYGQYCDEESGRCEDDTRDHCGECSIFDSSPACGTNGDCFYFGGESCSSAADCLEGYDCDNVPGYGKICHADICFETCNPNAEEACPRGFQCADLTGLGEYYCYADCVYMRNNGYF